MASEVEKPGLKRAIEVVNNFRDAYEPHDNGRKRFDIIYVKWFHKQCCNLIIEDLEAAAELREPWNPTTHQGDADG